MASESDKTRGTQGLKDKNLELGGKFQFNTHRTPSQFPHPQMDFVPLVQPDSNCQKG